MNTIVGGMPVWVWVLGAIGGIAIPLGIQHGIEPLLYRRQVVRNRAELAKFGLSPKRYLATIPTHDTARRVKAMVDMGIDESGRDDPTIKGKAMRLVIDK